MVTIRNLTKRTVVFNLPHAFACSEEVCTCSRVKMGVEEHDPVTGDRAVRAINRRLGASFTLFPKGHTEEEPDPNDPEKKVRVALDRVSDLLPQVRRVPEVARALLAGEIEITDQPDAAPELAPADKVTKSKAAPAAVKE